MKNKKKQNKNKPDPFIVGEKKNLKKKMEKKDMGQTIWF